MSRSRIAWYPLAPTGETEIKVKPNSIVLGLRWRGHAAHVSVLEPASATAKTKLRFLMVRDGEDIPLAAANCVYLGEIFICIGDYYSHAFLLR